MKTSEMPVEMFPSKCWEKPLKLGAERDSLKFERERERERERESLNERGREKESGRKKVISHLRARKKMKTVISRSSFLDLILKLSKACSWLLLVTFHRERKKEIERERVGERQRKGERVWERGWSGTNRKKSRLSKNQPLQNLQIEETDGFDSTAAKTIFEEILQNVVKKLSNATKNSSFKKTWKEFFEKNKS